MPLSAPFVCLVTDRGRLAVGTDDDLVRLSASAAAAGIDVIQVRERSRTDRELLALTRRLVAVSAGTAARVVVNDRTDIAIAAGAAGVHLRGDSVPADRVRAIVPASFIIGRSVHTVDEARAAARSGVDYLVMGTVYPTKSKGEGAPVAGVSTLAAVCSAVAVPVLAIGGITIDRVGEVASAGASGIAAIGLFADVFNAQRSGDLDAALAELIAAIRSHFRSAGVSETR